MDSLHERLFGVPGKVEDYQPTGRISAEELTYCRQDVRATTAVLNELKREFDRHPLPKLYPDKAYSPASIAKAYLDAMGVMPPKQKFNVSDRVLGIAMQAYYGGRAECRIRRVPVPIVHTDFTSQYPTVNALLDNWKVLTAQRLRVEDATAEVRALVKTVTLDDTFSQDFWKDLSFFARVRPDRDIFPVRTVYNGQTQNIGINRLTSEQPLWFAGPDVIAATLLGGKAPHIEEAIRLVPEGTQEGLHPTNVRGMVAIDPHTQDFFRHLVKQRKQHAADESLAAFLKTLANAGSYGLFVELNPEKPSKPVPLTVYSGDTSFVLPRSPLVEQPGPWYFPPIAALITAGGRLLLAMLEGCVEKAGGTYLFCDTDSLCIVASAHEQLVSCPGGSRQWERPDAIKALSRAQVVEIANRFTALNPYETTHVPGSILRIVEINNDAAGRPRHLFGYAISAKRYALYEHAGDAVAIIDPKAHGLGYLYPPKAIEKDDEDALDWTFEAWEWLVRDALDLPATDPTWLQLPAMMRVVLSTPLVLERLNRRTRPYNFLFCPLIMGYPAGVDPKRFTLIAPFTKRRERWLDSRCINVYDGTPYSLALQQTEKLDKVIPQTFGSILRRYRDHPEAKSLAPDGTPCTADTQGLLKRASVIAGAHRYVGKETDRRWVHGEHLSLLESRLIAYEAAGGMVVADAEIRRQLDALGMREAMRRGVSQHTQEKILDGQPVRRATLLRVIAALNRD